MYPSEATSGDHIWVDPRKLIEPLIGATMTIEIQRMTRYQRNPSVETAPLGNDGQLLLFLPQLNRFYALNLTSSFVWTQMQEPTSPNEIAQKVCENFKGVTPSDASADVDDLLRNLVSLNLVANVSDSQLKGEEQ
jgi:hypothetical protein